ncbi:MBL fold metallo-hydrolase [Burkholderia sp. PU8-34]
MCAFPFPSRQIGEFSVTSISDGMLTAGLDLLSNIDPADAARILRDAGVPDPSVVNINCYVIRGNGRTILVDAGAGGIRNWGGRLKSALPLAGVAPTDIDTILLTHAHPDHVGGLIDTLGRAAFPDAELVVHQREIDFWQDDESFARASERAQGNFRIARQVFDAYRTALRTVDAGEVLPGIAAVPLPGHTPGHTGYLVESRGERLLIWGDVVHFAPIQVARPHVSIAFDHDPSRASATRATLFAEASAGNLLIAGMHLAASGFARITRTHDAYAIVAAP